MANTQVLRLIRAVDAADSPAELVKAVEDLAATGAEAAIPTLIAVLSYSNPRAARAAVDGLIKLDITAVPFLLEHIQEGSSYSARAWAIEALSGIGDPQGLETLLRATTQDFSMSVRRAAARGLGKLRWQMMASEQVLSGQSKVIETLFQAVQDSEWIVRYAAVVGLQGFAAAVFISCPSWVISIEMRLAQTAGSDDSLAVQARALLAQQQIQPSLEGVELKMADSGTSAAEHWQLILERLYSRKAQERSQGEGSPEKFRAVAAAIQDRLGEQTR